jgi:hypothetical protein
MWNSFNFGGYLLDALSPAQKVFIDGRNDTVYSVAQFMQAMGAARTEREFDAQVARYDVTYAVVECTGMECSAQPWLMDSADWALVYWDDRAAVLVRRDPRTADYVARFGYRALRPRTALRRVTALATDPDADALEADVLRLEREAPRSSRASYVAAMVHRLRGRSTEYAASRARFVELAAENDVEVAPP